MFSYPTPQQEREVREIMNSPAAFRELVKKSSDLTSYVKNFPMFTHELINPLLTDPAEYTRLIKTSFDLIFCAKAFPAYANQLIKPLLTDPAEFRRLTEEGYDLVKYATYFPDYADQLMELVLSDPKEFKRLFQKDFDFIACAGKFSKYTVFKAKTLQEAIQLVEEAARIATYTKGATVGALANGDLSSILPEEITYKIGTFLSQTFLKSNDLGRKELTDIALTCKDAFNAANGEAKQQKK